MAKKTEKRAARRYDSSGRRRKRKEAREELWVVKTEHRAPRRCSSGLWRKKIQALRKSEEETNRKKQEAEAESFRKKQEAEGKAAIKANIRAAAAWEDGFDTGQYNGLWGRGGNDCPLVVTLYAKLGLHRYNMLQGTNFQLHGIEKYSRSRMLMPASYYITLVAEDPATLSSRIPFQTHVCEKRPYEMSVVCYIARLKETGTAVTDPSDTLSFYYENSDVPKWPSEKAFADKDRSFYELQESEWGK